MLHWPLAAARKQKSLSSTVFNTTPQDIKSTYHSGPSLKVKA